MFKKDSRFWENKESIIFFYIQNDKTMDLNQIAMSFSIVYISNKVLYKLNNNYPDSSEVSITICVQKKKKSFEEFNGVFL